MSAELDPALIRELVNEIIVQNYVSIATLTILIFDLIDTIEMEIKFFWQPRQSAVAILYFLNRYGAILVTVLQLLSGTFNGNENICRVLYFSSVFKPMVMLCVDYILLLRVQALYSRGRAITIFLFSAFGMSAIAGIVIVIQGLLVEGPEAVGIAPGLTVCLENTPPAVEAPLSWGIPLAYGALLMALALYKAAAIWKESAGLNGLSLVKVLIRDQAIYFLAVVFVTSVNIGGDILDHSFILGVALDMAGNPVFLSILGARLLFNMKEAGEKGLNQGTSCPTTSTVSDIDFAAHSVGAAESSLGEAAGGSEVERDIEADIEEVV